MILEDVLSTTLPARYKSCPADALDCLPKTMLDDVPANNGGMSDELVQEAGAGRISVTRS